MRSPRPHSEEWWRWKRNRVPGESYENFMKRKIEENLLNVFQPLADVNGDLPCEEVSEDG